MSTKMTRQSGFFVSDGVERSTKWAKAEHEVEEKRMKVQYNAGALSHKWKRVLEEFYSFTKRPRGK
jgi:hypothetical protein